MGITFPLKPLILFALFLSGTFFASTDAYDALDPDGNITITWDINSWTAYGYNATVTIFNFQQYRHIESPGWTLGWRCVKKEVIWRMLGGQATKQEYCSIFIGSITIRWDINMHLIQTATSPSDGILTAGLLMATMSLSRSSTFSNIATWRILGGQATEQEYCSRFIGSIPHSCKESLTVVDLLLGASYNQKTFSCCKGGVISSLGQESSNTAASAFQLSIGSTARFAQ